MDWNDIKLLSMALVEKRQLPSEYSRRVAYEIKEIEKQGANALWTDWINQKKKWDKNPNGLVLPWLFGCTPVDPVVGNIKHNESYQTDFPDIDLDFLPHARDTIKKYASEKYKHVCSVGSWVTYKPKSALQDVARAFALPLKPIMDITTSLPDDFDEMELEELQNIKDKINDQDPKVREDAEKEYAKLRSFYNFWESNENLVKVAYKLVGKIKAQGTHAGGLIIADRPILDIVPLSLAKGEWKSQWTEGKITQLSKFGLVKFDILGVKTVFYVWQAGNLIKEKFGIDIDWSDMDPEASEPYLGWEVHPDGTKKPILMNDPESLVMTNELRTDSVFQIESAIQKGIIRDGKVKSFWDLVVYNAMGRPGPIDMIPEYIKRRDDTEKNWMKGVDPRITEILGETFNVIVYQEQLQAMWIALAGFTVPEAESARKIIAKKWVDKLAQVETQWKRGAGDSIGAIEADKWWDLMQSFGRYAFNLSHSVAYSIITFRCLWLKCHYPAQWWAAVMTACHSKKLPNYINASRLDKIKFATFDVNNLTNNFTVNDKNEVVPGVVSIRGVGKIAAQALTSIRGPFQSIRDVIEKFGKNKTIFESLIKLGAFDQVHQNRHALWIWYQYNYCPSPEIKKFVEEKFGWSEEQVVAYREKKKREYFAEYPKRKKVPKAIENWKPKIEPSYDDIAKIVIDYSLAERLQLEKDLLGYNLTSPMDCYRHHGFTISKVRKTKGGKIEGVIQRVLKRYSKAGNVFYTVKVTDGIESIDIAVWESVYMISDQRLFHDGVGINIQVDYSADRNSYKIANGTTIIPLQRIEDDPTTWPVEDNPLLTEDYPLW